MTERTLFAAEFDTSDPRRIIRKDLESNEFTVLHNIEGGRVKAMAVMNDSLLIVKDSEGLKSVPKDSRYPVKTQQVDTTGLEDCDTYHSVHVVEGKNC